MGQEPFVCVGYLVVCSLVGIAVKIMLSTFKLTTGGPMFSTLILLALAAVVLQPLPDADSGLQFLPVAPWAYTGFVPTSVSILSWFDLFFGALFVVTGCTDAPTVFSAAMLFSMTVNLLLSFFG